MNNMELLTGKCKEDFLKWLDITYDETYEVYFTNWDEFPFSYQSGVYLEFFDSIGKYIEVIYEGDFWGFQIFEEGGSKTTPIESIGGYNSRKEALIAAIKEANNRYNE